MKCQLKGEGRDEDHYHCVARYRRPFLCRCRALCHHCRPIGTISTNTDTVFADTATARCRYNANAKPSQASNGIIAIDNDTTVDTNTAFTRTYSE